MRSIVRPGTRAAILAMPLLMLLPAPVPAQALPPLAQQAPDVTADVIDPPTRVGRIARMSGQVSYRLPGEENWQPAAQNIPITEGNAVYATPGGRALLEVGQSRIALEGGTDLQMATLDDTVFAATMPRGSAYVVMSGLAPRETAQIVTPEAGVTLATEGRYLVQVPEGAPARVAVLEGEALLATASGELRLTSGQAALLAPGADPRIEQAGPGSPLVAWADGALPRQRMAIPVAAQGMTGINELAGFGSWANAPDYGQVWYPNVQQGWAPYRDGAWQWVDPWGWTWVDAQPWGYAPSHYGRWVQVGSRWAWAPIVAAVATALAPRPVWSPANVRFFGGSAYERGYAPVGWVPLAPREAYYPWYRASARYVERLNYRYVPNVRQVTSIWMTDRGRGPQQSIDQFRNRRWATVVPAEAMRDSRPIRQSVQRFSPQQWQRLAAVQDGPPRPGPQTRGLTPQDARRFDIAPDSLRAPPSRQGPSLERHAVLRERLPQDVRGSDRRERRDGASPGAAGNAPRSDQTRTPRSDDVQRAAIERQRNLMEEQRRRATAQDRQPGGRESRGDSDRQRDAVQQRREIDEQQRRGAEQRQIQDEQRQAAEDQRRRAADQRDAAEQRRAQERERRAAEEQRWRGEEQRRRGAEQQRSAAEQQQRQAQEQQRRAAEQQQRQAQEQQRRQAEQQQRQAQEQQRRAAEQQQRQMHEQQRRQTEQQQRQAQEQQRHAAEQQQRQAQEQQRRAAEQQQRQAQEQQRRAAEQQQRQAQEQQRRQAEQQQRRAQEQQHRQRDANRDRGRDDPRQN